MASTLLLSPHLSFPTVDIDTDPDHHHHQRPIIKRNSAATGLIQICRNIQELKQIHGQMMKMGPTTAPVSTKLIAACARIATPESLNYARKAFQLLLEEEEEANLFLWNSLIRGYASAGIGQEAIYLYLQMVMEGVLPDHFTFPFLLTACTKIAAASEGIQFHASLIKMGLGTDAYILNSLIHFYSECEDLTSARKVFDGMPERNVVSWTSLICGYAHRDSPEDAVSLFWEMVRAEAIRPNSVTMACVVSACAKLQDLDLGERVCSYIGESGIGLNAVLVNALVDMYMKCGAMERAELLFGECSDRNLVLYNTMVSNYVRLGLAKEALAVFDEMIHAGLKPDRVTIIGVISACSHLGKLVSGRQCHGYVLRNALDGWDAVINSIIDMYMKCGVPETACRVFDTMLKKTIVSWNTVIAGYIRNGDLGSAQNVFSSTPEKDIVSWNTMIGALVQEDQFEEVITLFRVMHDSGVKADRVTMVSIASACGYLGALDLAKWIHAYIDKNEIPCDVRLGTALVDMYARCGDPRSSMQVFEEMPEKDVSAWTAAIGAMAMEGNGKQAIQLFNEMVQHGVKPDGVAFVAVLTACSHGGLVEEGRCLFRSMSDNYDLLPQIVHYGCMVDLFGRAGLFGEAHMLIESMPIEPNSVIWGALLAACRIHNNVELADHVAKQVMESAPDHSGIHVLISNIYASAGKWSDVARVRMHLKDIGAQKLPGSSSVEVNGVIHEFTSGDESHRQMIQIVKMLDEINSRLKHTGHVPDLGNVLLDVSEAEKEHLLGRHSEKLAMAFGLISTGHGAPIRVIKNLRMCSDCHTFAKLVSGIYSREIVVRDNNQFHYFQRGQCSCMDYW
ncbi:pentatricopeptide repeat-containing protein At3g22690 [Magnolia sinica]|uniref:pentatricopeptide repeat-containing protein At3g22690 n=1 Tax=Magnolia sinica TaxID=86752 RepID=UPI00265B3278|nr:pentatricopeptide repeat-containing protein At3g22690 [Magnolia sinica]